MTEISTTSVVIAFIAAVPTTLVGLAALVDAMKINSKLGAAEDKLNNAAHKTEEVHALVNSNFSRIQKQLHITMTMLVAVVTFSFWQESKKRRPQSG